MRAGETRVLPKRCGDCGHWSPHALKKHEDGYLVAYCTLAADSRDWKVTRASDGCAEWKRRRADEPDYSGLD